MILSDSEILKRITSWEILYTSEHPQEISKNIGPASIDFRLGNHFKVYKRDKISLIDPRQPHDDEIIETITVPEGEAFILHPRQFVLGVTMETIGVPYDLVARCEGRSSLGRLGIIIHSTAGFIDPGFKGTITLEITNINEIPIKLYPGMRFGQFAFETIAGKVETPYDQRKSSKYMNQSLPEHSRIALDSEHQ